VDALAGTGKTTTCVMIAEEKPTQGVYLTFNKALQREADARFPDHVDCRTTHSVAFQAAAGPFRHRMGAPRMRSADIAAKLGIGPMMFESSMGSKKLSPSFLAGMVTRGIRRFCASADPEPLAKHIPMPTTMGDDDELMAVWRTLRPRLTGALRQAWVDLSDPGGEMPYEHDAYLKLFQLGSPKIEGDYLLLDEAQDTSDCVLDIVSQQRDHMQVIYVGDTHQSIYQWRGAVDAMAKADVSGRAALTWSFRFGPEIAEQANEVLATLTDMRLVGKGKPGVVGRLNHPDVVLSRSNAAAVTEAFEELNRGGKPHVVGGGRDVVSFAFGAKTMIEDGWTSHPDLVCFDSWDDVVDYTTDDELGGDLKMLVGLVTRFTPDGIVRALKGQASESKASLILSTAHGAKGREWDSVKLAGDFPDSEDGGEERRLLYVAVTRPRDALDVTLVDTLNPDSDDDDDGEMADLAPSVDGTLF